jgi:hypothetical protein
VVPESVVTVRANYARLGVYCASLLGFSR